MGVGVAEARGVPMIGIEQKVKLTSMGRKAIEKRSAGECGCHLQIQCKFRVALDSGLGRDGMQGVGL